MKLMGLACTAGMVLVSGGCTRYHQAPMTAPEPAVAQSAGSEPLILVDGRVVDSAEMNRIDPARIDKVEVLKGTAAAERYGSRGANGVIVITLKQPS